MTRFEPSTSMKIWILEGKKLLKLWGWNPCSRTHCVILEHYYSVDFPWWFHRNFFLSVYFEEQLKKFVKSECEESYSSDLTELFCGCFKKCLQNLHINLEAKRMDGFSWIFFYYISYYSICCSWSPFHREWLALIRMLML